MAEQIKYVSLENLTQYDGKIKTYLADADKVIQDKLDAEAIRAQGAELTNAQAAEAAQQAADKAQGEVDALETYVGAFTASEGVDTVVKYVDAKTATNAADIEELNTKVDEIQDLTDEELDAILNPPALINFYIDGETFQAEEGMTWDEWEASEYNVHPEESQYSGKAVEGLEFMPRGVGIYLDKDWTQRINGSDAIIAEYSYRIYI